MLVNHISTFSRAARLLILFTIIKIKIGHVELDLQTELVVEKPAPNKTYCVYKQK